VAARLGTSGNGVLNGIDLLLAVNLGRERPGLELGRGGPGELVEVRIRCAWSAWPASAATWPQSSGRRSSRRRHTRLRRTSRAEHVNQVNDLAAELVDGQAQEGVGPQRGQQHLQVRGGAVPSTTVEEPCAPMTNAGGRCGESSSLTTSGTEVVAGRTRCRGMVDSVKPAYPRASRGRSRGHGAAVSLGHLARSGAAVGAAVSIVLPALLVEARSISSSPTWSPYPVVGGDERGHQVAEIRVPLAVRCRSASRPVGSWSSRRDPAERVLDALGDAGQPVDRGPRRSPLREARWPVRGSRPPGSDGGRRGS